MAVPFSTLSQEIYRLEILRPERIEPDLYEQNIAFYEFPSVEAGSVREMGFKAVVRLWDIRYSVRDISMDDLGSIEDDLLILYTGDHEILGKSDPVIQKALQEISVEKNSVIQTLWNIRTHIYDHLEYVRDSKHDPAPVVLSRGSGSCSEYSRVFLSMARALGIPTRFGQGSSGKNADKQNTYIDKVFHRWVEVYFPEFGWVPIDANRDDSKSGDYSPRLFLAYDWKAFQIGARFTDDGEFLKTNLVVYHRWSLGENKREDGKVDIDKHAKWQLVPGYY